MRETLLDTSALLYWTLLPERLTSRAQEVIEESETLLVLTVSLWEIALKHGRGALELPIPPQEFASRLGRAQGVVTLALDTETAVAGALLDWEHRDPADRWLVATAMRRNCSLVTSDRRIREFLPQAIW